MPVCHASLTTADLTYKDIQIWTDTSYPGLERSPSLSYVSHVNRHRIPVFLVSLGSFRVYSAESSTESFFAKSLLQYKEETGLLAKAEGPDMFAVFYGDADLAVWCFLVDFAQWDEIKRWSPSDKSVSVYFDRTTQSAKNSNITIFDRVLENKGAKKPVIKPQLSLLSNLVLSTNQQISQAVSKVVLSGLRLRGLSINENSSQKVAVREIYHMTRKAAMFSLRKFNYSFNGSSGESVRLEHIQDIVERLLEVFIDIESPRELLRSS